MKTTKTTAAIERRFTTGKVELRESADGKPAKIRGYAAVFGSPSENLGGFIEVIAKRAFDDVLADDVRGLFNHDANLILGRTKSGTMKIGSDENGLWYEITPADTQVSRDLLVSLKRGDVDQSSFAFSVKREGQEWKDHPDNPAMQIRTITKVARLYDVSPVTYPAYPDTEASARTLEEAKAWRTESGGAGDADAKAKADAAAEKAKADAAAHASARARQISLAEIDS